MDAGKCLPQDSRLAEGIRLFNSGEFFECHDVLEDLWTDLTGPDKTFVQGLIHAAVCLFHFEEGNPAGAVRMYGTCSAYLQTFEPDYCGIHVTCLLDELKVCLHELLQARDGYPRGVRLLREHVPKIRSGSDQEQRDSR